MLEPVVAGLKFELPPDLEAHEPPEARGLARDEVRLLVSYRSDNRVLHATFRDLPSFLAAGDVLVINTSGTLNAALNAMRSDGTPLELHLSTHLPGDEWMVELRRLTEQGTAPFYEAHDGETFGLPGGATVMLQRPYSASSKRLWTARLRLPCPLEEYLARYGFPIRYGYVRENWPISYYQTVYATETGSAEMPSAGRPFTPELIVQLIARGVQIVPLILHTGVASPESHEPPYDEYYRVRPETANVVNAAHAARKRVVAVGTTVVRALESVTDMEGVTWAGDGWTQVVVTPQRGLRTVNALLTGFHEPRATHWAMLEALAGREHLQAAYASALEQHYLWHEFGDVHLILP
ncbi:MAG: S-adenosylmethionine:tRNA ribosyltransferase-isomerase [Chloroflexi bacterium]|nr:S-adenosylmethionine:tRNA ribosyltransferase-isomerase [Chloroflexota bacterium]